MTALRVLRAFSAALIALALAAVPASAAVSRKAAGERALAALGVKQGEQPVVVFEVARALTGGTLLSQAGEARAPKPRGKLGTDADRAPILLRVAKGHRAWAFYADWAPYQAFAHRGQLVIVDAATGRARLSRSLTSPPVIGGSLPTFMRSGTAYASAKSRIFVRDYVVPDPVASALARRATTQRSSLASRSRVPRQAGIAQRMERTPFGNGALAKQAADQLAADHVCSVRASDTFGDFYDFTGSDETRASLGDLFYLLRQLNPGIVDERYSRSSDVSPTERLRELITEQGCKDVLFYVAGRGFSSGDGTTVSVGTRLSGRTVTQQLVRAADLARVVRAFPGVRFSVKVDAPHSKPFVERLAEEPNVLLAESAAGADGNAFGDLPYVVTASGKRITNVGNPDGLLSFTNRTIAGVDRFLASASEVDSAIAARKSGVSPSFLAQLLGRAFALGAADDLPAQIGVQKPFFAPTTINPKGPPPSPAAPPATTPAPTPNRAPVGSPAAVSTAEDTPATFSVPVTDPDGDALSITGVSGPAHGTVATNGLEATYTPAADYAGPDQISFTISDPKGLTAEVVASITVTAVNDRPRLTTSPGNATFSEGGLVVVVDGGLTIADPDNATLTGATVQITGGRSADDELAFTDAGAITGTFDGASGTLTLAGAASRADYEAALRSITFAVTGPNPAAGTRTVAFQASDGEGPGAAAERTIAVNTINDAPVLTGSGATVTYTENAAPQVIDATFAITDPDSPVFAGATVQITAGLEAGQDRLAFAAEPGITGTYDIATGRLSLSGAAPRASYEAVLRSVTYENLSDDPTATRTTSTQVDDGSSASAISNTVTGDIAITAVNDAPVLATTAAAASYTEDTAAVVVDAGITVTDPDSAELSGATITIGSGRGSTDALGYTPGDGITVVSNAAGVLTLTGDASPAAYQAALRRVTFIATGDDPSTATRTITFVASDTAPLASAGATRTLELAAVNDAPVLAGGPFGPLTYTEDDPGVAIVPTITAADPDDENLAGLSVTISGGRQSNDLLEFAALSGVNGGYDAATGVLSLDGSASVAAYQTLLRSITFRTTDQDPVATARTIDVLVDDGHASSHFSNTTTVQVGVAAVNDRPVVQTSSGDVAFAEGGSPVIVDGDLSLSDVDNVNLAAATVDISAGFQAGDTLAVTPAGAITPIFNAATGVLTLTGPASKADFQTTLRSLTYANASIALPTGFHTVRFVVSDGALSSLPATRRVNFGAINSAPVLTTSGTSTPISEGSAGGAIDAALTVSDPDDATLAGATVSITAGLAAGDELVFSAANGISASANSGGVLTLTGSSSVANYQAALRSVRFRNLGPAVGSGTRTVTFSASDASGDTDSGTQGITFTAVDDPPVVATSIGATTWAEGDPAEVVDPDLDVSDPDSANLVSAEVSVAANAVAGDRLTVPTPLPAGLSVATNGTALVTITGSASPLVFRDLLRTVTFDSTSANPTSATRGVRFRVSDATTTVTATVNKSVTVVPDNSPPVAADDDLSTDEDSLLSDSVRANDTDPDDATSTLVVDQVNGSGNNVGSQITLGSGAKLTVSASGAVSYDPRGIFDGLQEDEEDTDSFTYRVKDPSGATSGTATATITVTGVDDAPVALARTYNAVTNAALELEPGGNAIGAPRVRVTGTLLAGVTDVDDSSAGATLVDQVVTSVGGGSADLDPDGSFVFVSEAGEAASTDSFSFQVEDVHGATSSQTVSVTFRDKVVFVDADNSGGADGTSLRPYPSVASATSVAGTSERIYIGESAAQTPSGATLKNGQRIQGAGGALTVDLGGSGIPSGTQTLVAAGTRPVLSAFSGAALTLASGNTLSSFDIDPSGSAGGITAASAGAVSITDVAVSDAGTAATGTAVNLASASGTIANLDITTQSAPGLTVNNSSVNIGSGSSVAATGGPAVTSTNSTGGALVFGTVSSTNSPATGLTLSGAGSFSATGGAISNPATTGINAFSGAGNVTYPGSVSVSGAAEATRVTFRTGGTLDFGGPITATGTGTKITAASNSSGTTVRFSGTSKSISSSGIAVDLGSNAGATTTFTNGGLAASSTGSIAFRGIVGGTIGVSGANNTLSAGGGGAALYLQNVTAAATFQSIDDTGGADGIVLDTVGGFAPLTVTGDGTNIDNGSGGTISGITGADGSTTTGNGIAINATPQVSLSQMKVLGSSNFGLLATGVSTLTFANGTLSGNGSSDNNGAREGNVRITGSTGLISFTKTTMSSPKTNDLWMTHNAGTATLAINGGSLLTVDPTVAGVQNAGVLVDGGATGTLTTTIASSTVNGVNGAAGALVDIRPGGSGTATWTANLTSSTFSSPDGSIGGEDTGGNVRLAANAFNGALNYVITGNTLRGAAASALLLDQDTGSSTVAGTVSGNTIGAGGVEQSGTSVGSDIAIDGGGSGTHTVAVTNNALYGFASDGAVFIQGGQGAGQGIIRATVASNTIGTPYTGAGNESFAGIYASFGTSAGPTGTNCLDVIGNSIPASGLGGFLPIYVEALQSVVVELPSYVGGATDDAAVENYLTARNPAATEGAVAGHSGSATWQPRASACPQP